MGLLALIGADLEQLAMALAALQLACAAVLVTLSLRTVGGPGPPEHGVVAEALDLGVAPPQVAVEDPHAADERPAPLGSASEATGLSQRTTSSGRAARAGRATISRCTPALVTTPGCITS